MNYYYEILLKMYCIRCLLVSLFRLPLKWDDDVSSSVPDDVKRRRVVEFLS